MHQTRARLRPRRGRRGCGLGYICRRFCGVGHGLLPYIVLLWVKGELRLRCRFFLRGRQVVVALFQFIPHGAHHTPAAAAATRQASSASVKPLLRKNFLICSIVVTPICCIVYALLLGLVWDSRAGFMHSFI